MSVFDWGPYLAGGTAGRDDSITGLHEGMRNSLAKFLMEAPDGLTINSAYRSPELQAQLYENALARYGNEAEARRWVALPGRSQHNHGFAVDLGFANDEARQWAHENAARFGLAFPLDNENWHLELAGARDGTAQSAPQMPAPQPGQQPMPTGRDAASRPAQAAQQVNALAMMDPAAFMSAPIQGVPVDFTPRRGYLRT